MTRLAPTLTTDRLVLRPQTPGDFPAHAALMASDRTRAMGDPHPERVTRGDFCAEALRQPGNGNADDHVNRDDPLLEDTR